MEHPSLGKAALAELGKAGIEDMIKLSVLNEESLLENLRLRYEQGEKIYTYTGSILVAVNPYKMFDIYALNMVKRYEGQVLGTLPPHLFAIGSASYSAMMNTGENQVIVISGESGAGKTESTKLTMQYLAAVNKSSNNLITEQILEASPLLESFGNAKTIRNDNSSRFGKYVQVHFKSGRIIGAKTSEYLLEKSRIVTQAPEERNYHVFYEMLAGLSEEDKGKYGLQTADKYFYLNQLDQYYFLSCLRYPIIIQTIAFKVPSIPDEGGSCEIASKNDRENYKALVAAMECLNFTTAERDTISKILASVLHLGNMYFSPKQLNNFEGVELGSDAELKWVCHLLRLSEDWLREAVTMKVTEARQERLLTPFHIDQALDARDAIAKALYSRLFTWLVERINQIVNKQDFQARSIAILDIFGFELFPRNSFEQLCINYANETLQYYFNKHIFKLEQEEYSKEHITWTSIRYTDNQPIIDLISKKPSGIIHLLDDESNFPKSTDLSFLEKCHFTHSGHPYYDKPRMVSPMFAIKHYAGKVNYDVRNFLDKNKDTLRGDVLELLIQSKNEMISKMFKDLREENHAKTLNKVQGRYVAMKPRTLTVAASFHESLLALIDTMSKCNPFFVRCIKPNNEKLPMVFDAAIVLSQLRYTGMLETIKIRKMGYPVRLRFQQFVDRYHPLAVGKLPKNSSAKEACGRILKGLGGQALDQYQVGITKVFLQEKLSQHLDQLRFMRTYDAAVQIQKTARGYIQRRRYRRVVSATMVIQKYVKCWIARKRYAIMRNGFIKAQAQFRMVRARKQYLQMRDEYRRVMEAERLARQRAQEKAEKEAKEREARSMTAVKDLQIPVELAYVFDKLDDWPAIHGERNLVNAVGSVAHTDPRHQLPADIDSYVFSKYVNVYFKGHAFGMRKFPIKRPYLSKTTDYEAKQSLEIFQLILRYMNDAHLTGKREIALADYIVHLGLANEYLRDEILCQLCSQVFQNSNSANTERGWVLVSACLSAFPPSAALYKYLLKFVSDQAYNGYKGYCQSKLLQCANVEPMLARTYPPCLLEWKGARKRANMALEIKYFDGETSLGHVESWSTAEQFASQLLQQRGVSESKNGWTIALYDEYDVFEAGGFDYVLDLISEMEIPPAFPVQDSYFLVSTEQAREPSAGKKNIFKESPHNADRQAVRVYRIDIKELREPIPMTPPPTPQLPGYVSGMRTPDYDYLPNLSQSRLNQRDATAADISRGSILNIRYIQRAKSPNPGGIPEEGFSPTLTNGDPQPRLAGSRLNDRYNNEEVKLSHTKLNDRYSQSNGHPPGGSRFSNGDTNESTVLSDSHMNQRYSKTGKGPAAAGVHQRAGGRAARDQILRQQSSVDEFDRHSMGSANTGANISDMDRWLDGVFDPILDQNVNALSNSHSVERVLKGGGKGIPGIPQQPLSRQQQPSQLSPSMVVDGVPGASNSLLGGINANAPIGATYIAIPPPQPGFVPGSAPGPTFPSTVPLLTAGAMSGQPQMASPAATQAALQAAQQAAQNAYITTMNQASQQAQISEQVQLQAQANYQSTMAQQLQQLGIENQILQQSVQQELLKQQLLTLRQHSSDLSTPTPPPPPTAASSDDPFIRRSVARGQQQQGKSASTSQFFPAQIPAKDVSSSGEDSPRRHQRSPSSTKGTPPPPPTYPGEAQDVGRGVSFAGKTETIPQNRKTKEASTSPPHIPSPGSRKSPSPPKTEPSRVNGAPAAHGTNGVAHDAPQQPPLAPSPPRMASEPVPAPPPPPLPEGHDAVDNALSSSPSRHVPAKIYNKTKGRERKVIRVGKIQWPPKPALQEKVQPEVGKLLIDEEREKEERLQAEKLLVKEDAHRKTMEIIQKRIATIPAVAEPPAPVKAKAPTTPKPTPPPAPPVAVKAVALSTPKPATAQKEEIPKIDFKERAKMLERSLSKPNIAEAEEMQSSPPPPLVPVEEPPRPKQSKSPLFPPPPPPPPPPVETMPPYKTLSAPGDPPPHPLAPPQPPPPPVPPEPRKREVVAEEEEKEPVVDFSCLENIKTMLYSLDNTMYYSYTRVPWTLFIRKEVFSPTEKLDNPLALNLVFCQIIQDVHSNACVRLSKEEKGKMRAMLESFNINPSNMLTGSHKNQTKKTIVDTAKDLPAYFSRIFPVYGGENLPRVQFVGVSHSGVRLMRRERGMVDDKLVVLEHFEFKDILDSGVPMDSTLQINIRGKVLVLYTHRARQIQEMLEAYCIENEEGNVYVKAMKDYSTRESTLLSFNKNDVIKLTSKDKQLHRGWLYGTVNGKAGMFPVEYVRPLSRHEMLGGKKVYSPLAASSSKTTSSSDPDLPAYAEVLKARRRAPAPVAAPRRGSRGPRRAVPHQEPQAPEPPRVTTDTDTMTSVMSRDSTALPEGKYSMLEFAMLHFRESLEKNKSRSKDRNSWSWKEQADMIKWTKSPIQASLLKHDNPELNKLSLECFVAIMRYMGDYPMVKGQRSAECVYTILMACHKHAELRDEVYCHMVKQTTNNRSSKSDSCQRGWRLFSILAAFFQCSDVLKPYLLKYLESNAYDSSRPYHNTAEICLQNLRKTFKHDGRKNVPSKIEIEQITRGRNTKRQMCVLPGGIPVVLNVRPCSVVQDAIEQVCLKLDISDPVEMEEFSLFYVLEKENHYMPLLRDEYIFDITTELENQKKQFYLLYQRTSWYFSLRLESLNNTLNNMYIEVMYHQCLPDYLDGFMLTMTGNALTVEIITEIGRLAALQFKGKDKPGMPTMKEVQHLIPSNVINLPEMQPQQWVNLVHKKLKEIERYSPLTCKVMFLELLCQWPLFGSTFFSIQIEREWCRCHISSAPPTRYMYKILHAIRTSVADPRVNGECLLAINKDGVHFLHYGTHETLVTYPFTEVISTRRFRADNNTNFLDMKCGNLMVQKITRVETDQGTDISTLIGQYIQVINKSRQKSRR